VIERGGGLTRRRTRRASSSYGRQRGRAVNSRPAAALHDQRSSHNVILQPDDAIFIPEYQPYG